MSLRRCPLEIPEGDLVALASAHDIPVHFLRSNKGPLIGTLSRYAGLLRRFEPDVVHTHPDFPRLLTGLLAALGRLGGARVVTTFHNDYPYFYERDLKSRFKRWTEKMALRWSHATVVCVSKEVVEVVGRLYGPSAPATVINNGISLPKREDHLRPVNRGGEKVVIAVGRLSRQKNYGLLLESWRAVLIKFPEAVLWFVGDGDERRGLEEKARNLDVAASIRFLGWQRNVHDFLKRASIFVLSSDHEGFPLSILEAQSDGVPVIATDVSGVNELIEQGVSGWIIERGDGNALTYALLTLMGDDELRRKIGKAGQASVYNKFAIDGYINRIESLYSRVLTGQSYA